MIGESDKDGDGKIGWEEWLAAMGSMGKGKQSSANRRPNDVALNIGPLRYSGRARQAVRPRPAADARRYEPKK